MKTPLFIDKSIDDKSDNFLWMSRNASSSKSPTSFKRKKSLDSFVNIFKPLAAIELAFKNIEKGFEEIKDELIDENQKFRQNHSLKRTIIGANNDIDRSPSVFLDVNDNFYRKGKVFSFSTINKNSLFSSQLFIQIKIWTFFKKFT